MCAGVRFTAADGTWAPPRQEYDLAPRKKIAVPPRQHRRGGDWKTRSQAGLLPARGSTGSVFCAVHKEF